MQQHHPADEFQRAVLSKLMATADLGQELLAILECRELNLKGKAGSERKIKKPKIQGLFELPVSHSRY